MRTPMSEILDLALTQSIERYMEMEPDTVYDAIVEEWPEQTAVILVEFLFKRICNRCDDIFDALWVNCCAMLTRKPFVKSNASRPKNLQMIWISGSKVDKPHAHIFE